MFRCTILALPLLTACSEYGMATIEKPYLGEDTAYSTEMDGESSTTTTDDDDCTESTTAFDIEEVSGLQDAFGLPHVRDGLMLEVPEEDLSGGKSWRPKSVEVLVMYPEWYFDWYDDSNSLSVHFYPSATPSSQPYSQTIQIKKNQLDWQPITLPYDADWSGDDRDQIGAWLTFDLTSIIPAEGFEFTEYFVSLEWDSMGYPNVGYSNFELPCTQNWTDYSNGSYTQNSGTDCSWPMLKIEIETLTPGDCE